MRIVSDTERTQIITSAERASGETLFQFVARVFQQYFDADAKEIKYLVRQTELTGNSSESNVPGLIRRFGHYFELDRTEVQHFYKLLQLAGKAPL
jgi:hypothetical protein